MVRGTFSPARAWRPAVVVRLARTLGRTSPIHRRPRCCSFQFQRTASFAEAEAYIRVQERNEPTPGNASAQAAVTTTKTSMPKPIIGEYRHTYSGKLLRYEARYRLSAIGVVYEADALFGAKRARLVQGVITWGLRALPPRRRVKEAVHETLDIVDVYKLEAKASE